MSEYLGMKLRRRLAQAAYCLAVDKEQVEKHIEVDSLTFEKCLVGMPEHHSEFNRKRGYIRTYHEAFWTENKEGLGRTYHHGVVHVLNKDSEINKPYTISNAYIENFEQVLQNAIKIKGHRLISITGDSDGSVEAKLTPQRNNFDD